MALLKRTSCGPGLAAPETAPPSREDLVTLMQTGATQAARRAAVQDLATYFAADRELAASLLLERDPVVQAAILTALVVIGTEAAATGVAEAVCTEDAGLRNAAVDALRGFGATALPSVERLLASPHSEQRIVGIGLLEARDDPGARDTLHHILADDPDLNVGLAAVEVLSSIGDAGDEAALLGFASRFEGNAFVAFAVELACRRTTTGDAA